MNKLRVAGDICLTALVFFWLAFVHYTEAYKLGIRWNFVTGEVSVDAHGGVNISPPWVLISRVDLRPQRLCITSTTRAVNCKLVQFVPAAFREFVATEGFRYYWLSNRISFNLGYNEEYRGWRDILRGYAFGVKQYPFITVVQEYKQ